MAGNKDKVTGGCLCGAVRFTIWEGPQATSVCHCGMCRRWTGGPMAAIHSKSPVQLDSADTLTWFSGSEWAERGFCNRCGTTLFYRLKQAPDELYPTAGALDDPGWVTGIDRHIFVDEKPPFYDFADDAPRLTGAETIALFEAAQDGQ